MVLADLGMEEEARVEAVGKAQVMSGASEVVAKLAEASTAEAESVLAVTAALVAGKAVGVASTVVASAVAVNRADILAAAGMVEVVMEPQSWRR